MNIMMKILIVEDEPFVAMDLEDTILDAGHEVVGTAQTAEQSMQLVKEKQPNLVLLDVHLADGRTGVRVAEEILVTHVSGGFHDGHTARLPAGLAGAIGVITIPCVSSGVVAALADLRQELRAAAAPQQAAVSGVVEGLPGALVTGLNHIAHDARRYVQSPKLSFGTVI